MQISHGPVPLLHDYLLQTARECADRIALVCNKQRISYGEINARSNSLAHALVASGVKRGDRVVVFADNTVETVISFWAVLKANAVVSIVNPLTKSDKLSYLLQDCRPTAFITDAHHHSVFAKPVRECSHLLCVIVSGKIDDEKLAVLPSARRWEDTLADGDGMAPPVRTCIEMDLAAIIYTSGSTGEPKGVMMTHRNMLTACASIVSYLEVDADEVILSVLSLSYSYGLYQMIMAFREGARLVLERSFAFPAQILNLMVDEEITAFPGVPTIFSVLTEFKTIKDYDLSRIRCVTNAAAALPVKHIQMLRNVFSAARIYSMYGLTECSRCSYLPPEDIDRMPLSIGIAIPNTEMWIVDEHDNKTAPGTVGQLVIRGANIMQGYWEKPEYTAKALRPGLLPGEKVFYTGDYCKMDENGYLYFVGRMDDIIKSRGEKVAPKEVEHTLMNIPGVKEAAVIGVPDDMLGQAVKAFVVFEEGVTMSEKQLQRECQSRLESVMVPKYIVVLPSLPKTDNGKIKKTGLS